MVAYTTAHANCQVTHLVERHQCRVAGNYCVLVAVRQQEFDRVEPSVLVDRHRHLNRIGVCLSSAAPEKEDG